MKPASCDYSQSIDRIQLEMYYILRAAIIITDIIYLMLYPLLSFIRYKRPPRIPPITDSLLTISATELAQKIRERKYTSSEVVRAYIERIKKVNPYINAVVEDRFEDALLEAQSCDALLEAGDIDIVTLQKQKPLFGIPFTVKESCPVKDLSNAGCSIPFKGRKAVADSVLVKMLRDDGAIPICVTNTPEMCSTVETNNYLHGRTFNPYDTRYTPGGSSGGEAALLGAGASLIGIGSDFVGSIRIPGLFCGIFGLKPTSRVIPTKDHFPMSDRDDFLNYLTFGPMTRYADDLSLLMKVISLKSNIDLHLDKPIVWKQTRVYYWETINKTPGILSMSSEFELCVYKATSRFLTINATVMEMPIKWPAALLEMIIASLTNVGAFDVLIDVQSKRRKNPAAEMIKAIFGRSDHTMPLLLFMWLSENLNLFPKEKTSRYLSEFKEFQQKLQELLGKNGLLIYPTFRVTAPFPELALSQLGNSVVYSGLANFLGFPSVQIPMGLNSKGMPIGVQIMAAPYQERLCLAAANELEAAFGGWVPPSISINN